MRLLKTYDKLNKFGIPLGYKRVEYLESTGAQYIDTGYSINTDTDEIIVNYTNASTQNHKWLLGEYETSKNFGITSSTITNTAIFYKGSISLTQEEQYYTVHTLIANSNGLYNDGVQKSAFKSYASTWNIYLFALNNTGTSVNGYFGYGKIYNYKHKRNGVLIRDFIPCLDTAGKPCLYDLVSKKAYYNQGTGADFSYGRQIIPVEYLESTGTQYVNTGITGTNENMGIDVTWAFSNNNANMCIFSSRSAQTANTFTLFWLKTASNQLRFDAAGQKYFATVINTSVSDDIFNFNYKSADGAIATLTNKTTEQIQTLTVGKLTTFSTNPLYLFASIDSGAVYSKIKMYSCKIYDGSTTLRDYIPCIDENNVGFMFDLVTNTIYDNAGTDNFLFGEEAYDYKLQTRLFKDNSLPAGYTQVEYLESTGTQYIDTGIEGKDGITSESRILRTSMSSNECFVGAYNGVNRLWLAYTFGGNWYRGYNNSAGGWTPSTPITDWFTVKVSIPSEGTVVFDCNGISISSNYTEGFTTGVNIQLFQMGNTGTSHYPAKGKINYCKLYENDVLVRDYIPAIDPSGVPCMYDRVSKTPFYNQGTGTFVIGKPVLPVMRFLGGGDLSKYTLLNYLESTGKQYIDTGFKPNPATTKIDCAFCALAGGSTQMFGARTVAASTNENNTNICFGIANSKIYIRGDWIRNHANLVSDIEFEEYIHLIAHNQTMYINDVEYAYDLAKNNTYLDYNFYLFACNTAGNTAFYNKIRQYYFKIYDNNTLVHNFLPALRNSDNKPGMLDIVTKQFFTNAGTEEFLFG